jgi:hypothetical protein
MDELLNTAKNCIKIPKYTARDLNLPFQATHGKRKEDDSGSSGYPCSVRQDVVAGSLSHILCCIPVSEENNDFIIKREALVDTDEELLSRLPKKYFWAHLLGRFITYMKVGETVHHMVVGRIL